jgi:protein phosphatase
MKPSISKEDDLHLEVAALTDRGQQRPLNEDAVYVLTTETADGVQSGLYVVCDGLGGHEAGEVASRLAIKAIVEELEPMMGHSQMGLSSKGFQQSIARAINRANQRVWAFNNEDNLMVSRRAGTTLTMAFVHDHSLFVANVGDSRAYACHEGSIEQITQDHSLVAQMVNQGVIRPHEQRQHPYRHIITRALGKSDEVEVDIFEYNLEAGDKLLLCSDGLWQAFHHEEELEECLCSGDAEHICKQLVNEANRRDGSDNISAVVVCVGQKAIA